MHLGGKTTRESQSRGKKSQSVKSKIRKTIKRALKRNITKKRLPNINIYEKKGRGAFLKGWSKAQPGTHERTVMQKSCGKTCFLGPNNSFPICRRHTCKVDHRGLAAAYIRAREYMTIKGDPKYEKIATKAIHKLSNYNL